jgi:hypothetical protein
MLRINRFIILRAATPGVKVCRPGGSYARGDGDVLLQFQLSWVGTMLSSGSVLDRVDIHREALPGQVVSRLPVNLSDLSNQ